MQAGAADYLIKGQFDTSLLERSIRYALERNRLIREVREFAMRDALTNLYSRRELYRYLEHELKRSERYRHTLTLMMIDVDGLKNINDTYGHQAGDEVIRQVAALLKSYHRTADLLARFGGDEFVVVMPETTAGVARLGAERFRAKIETTLIPVLANGHTAKSLSATPSMGIAEFPAHAITLEGLIEAADQALYEAKRLGRNRIVVQRAPVVTTTH